jgi:hypothetical protein
MVKTRRKLPKQFAILNASAKIALSPKSTISLKIDFLQHCNQSFAKSQKPPDDQAAAKKRFTIPTGLDINLSLIFNDIIHKIYNRPSKRGKRFFYGKKKSDQINHKKESIIPQKKRLKTIRGK